MAPTCIHAACQVSNAAAVYRLIDEACMSGCARSRPSDASSERRSAACIHLTRTSQVNALRDTCMHTSTPYALCTCINRAGHLGMTLTDHLSFRDPLTMHRDATVCAAVSFAAICQRCGTMSRARTANKLACCWTHPPRAVQVTDSLWQLRRGRCCSVTVCVWLLIRERIFCCVCQFPFTLL